MCHVREVLNTYCWYAGGLLCYLYKAIGVVAARITHHHGQISPLSLGYHCLLAALGCGADIDMYLGLWIEGLNIIDNSPCIPLRKRCLGRDCQLCPLLPCEPQSIH